MYKELWANGRCVLYDLARYKMCGFSDKVIRNEEESPEEQIKPTPTARAGWNPTVKLIFLQFLVNRKAAGKHKTSRRKEGWERVISFFLLSFLSCRLEASDKQVPLTLSQYWHQKV